MSEASAAPVANPVVFPPLSPRETPHSVWLVRHGESAANAGEATGVYAQIPLTARGLAQAEAFARTCPQSPDRIVVSPYLRAATTSEALQRRFPEVPVLIRPVEEFTYLPFLGNNVTTAQMRRADVDAYWARLSPTFHHGPGSESFEHLLLRGRNFLTEAVTWPGFSVVFSHEQFIRVVVLLALYGNLPSSEVLMRRFLGMRTGLPIPNTAVVRLQWHSNCWWLGGVDLSHLPSE